MIRLPPDFRELLSLLSSNGVEYLVIGGYAVGYYGHPRATGDMDLWVGREPGNVRRLIAALSEFGFEVPELEVSRFLTEDRVLRMGVPPLRVEVLNSISGVEFAECYAARKTATVDDIDVKFISLSDLKTNKKASGRLKDLSDLESLENL